MNIFSGAGVALITPFKKQEVDFESFDNYCRELLSRKVKAFVVAGSTGEPHSLNGREKAKLLSCAKSIAKNQIPVIAGIMKSNTSQAVFEAETFASLGADALLTITPYCSKSTPDGLKEHFRLIRQKSGMPIILYDVPARTAVDLSAETICELFENGSIQAVKFASRSIEKAIDIIDKTNGECPVFSGEDALTVPLRSIGAKGSISVLAGVYPEIAESLFDLPFSKAGRLQREIAELVKLLFCEVNPVPVKYLLSTMGFCENSFRLPLTPLSKEKAEKLLQEANRLMNFVLK